MIHEKLKLLRKAKGISQVDMALKLHKSQNTYSRIEAGIAKIDADLIPDICLILEATPNELFEFENNAATNKQMADYREIIKLFKEEFEKKNEMLLILADTLNKVGKLKDDNQSLIKLLNITRNYLNAVKE
ncbi:MAG: helix-turn-helix domain-containing protein [Niabella sp.]